LRLSLAGEAAGGTTGSTGWGIGTGFYRLQIYGDALPKGNFKMLSEITFGYVFALKCCLMSFARVPEI
jgi:hypothetical protein